MIDFFEFLFYMFRPRAIRAWWRLGGTFELMCRSEDWHTLESAYYQERRYGLSEEYVRAIKDEFLE